MFWNENMLIKNWHCCSIFRSEAFD